MSRAYTKQECIKRLAYVFRNIFKYWQAEIRQPDLREKISGTCFTILSTLDGCSMGIPSVKIINQVGDDLTENGLHDHYHHPSIGESLITTTARIIGQKATSCEEAVIMFIQALHAEKLVLSMDPHPDDMDYNISEGENWFDPDITFTPQEILAAFQAT